MQQAIKNKTMEFGWLDKQPSTASITIKSGGYYLLTYPGEQGETKEKIYFVPLILVSPPQSQLINFNFTGY